MSLCTARLQTKDVLPGQSPFWLRVGMKVLLWGAWEPWGGASTEGGKGAVPVPINHAVGARRAPLGQG